MIYLIDPVTDKYGHHLIYLNSLLKISGTKALQMDVDTNRMKPKILTVIKYYNAIRKQLKAVPKGNIAHLLYADIYYKIPFLSSGLLKRNRTVVTIHSCPHGKLKHWLMKNFCKRVAAVVVHSEYIKGQMEIMGLKNVYCVDYPSFYDYSGILSKDELKKRENIKCTDVVFSALGGIRSDKGLDILLNACKYMDEEYKRRMILNVAGREGFLTARQVDKFCKDNNIRAHLVIRPLTDVEFQENVEISDYIVMPYRSRMTGNSGPMTEAIVRRIPSIVPCNGNLGYIAEHYHVGLTFKVEDSLDLARVMCKAMDKCYVCNSEYSMKLEERTFVRKHRDVYFKINQM